eukprot:5913019-Amphidinium_carterae.1
MARSPKASRFRVGKRCAICMGASTRGLQNGTYHGLPVSSWQPKPFSPKAPDMGAAKGYWLTENGGSGFFAVRWIFSAGVVEVCSNSMRKGPSRSFRLKSNGGSNPCFTPLGFIHVEYTLGDLTHAFIDVDHDCSVCGWFEGHTNHGTCHGDPCPYDDPELWTDTSGAHPQRQSAMEYPSYWRQRTGSFRSLEDVDPSDSMFGHMKEL